MQTNSILIEKNCRAKSVKCNNFFVWLISILVFAFVIVLIAFPEKFLPSVLDGLLLFSNAVLPSLLPFLFLTKILTELGFVEKISKIFTKFFEKVFRVPGIASYVFLMSLLCGYPVGIKIVSDLKIKGAISDKEAAKMLPFASTSGPLFVVGTVGFAMFGDKTFGILLFICHVLGTITSAFVLNVFQKKNTFNQKQNKIQTKEINFDNLLSETAFSTVSSVLVVGCFVTMFFLLIEVLFEFSILLPFEFIFSKILSVFHSPIEFSTGLSSGIVELTRGCRDLSKIALSPVGFVCSSVLISWGGLSVFAQSATFLSLAKIKIGKLFLVKLSQTFFTLLFAFVFCFFV